jgi:predicted Na+-dependent transporter
MLLLVLKLVVVVMIVAIGMSSKLGDIAYLARRPRLMLRSLLAMYLLVPMVAVVVVKLVPMPASSKAALLVLSISAGAPLLPRKLLFLADGAYVFGLAVISSLFAIVVAPAWVALLAGHFGADVQLSALTVAVVVAKGFLLPLGTGMIVHAIRPAWSERVAERALAVAGVALAAAGIALLLLHLDLLLEVSLGGIVGLALVMVVSLGIGHALGGPAPGDRTALAIACATRHIGIAILVAASFPGPRTSVLIVAYLLAALLVSTPYLRRRKSGALGSGAGSAA